TTQLCSQFFRQEFVVAADLRQRRQHAGSLPLRTGDRCFLLPNHGQRVIRWLRMGCRTPNHHIIRTHVRIITLSLSSCQGSVVIGSVAVGIVCPADPRGWGWMLRRENPAVTCAPTRGGCLDVPGPRVLTRMYRTGVRVLSSLWMSVLFSPEGRVLWR